MATDPNNYIQQSAANRVASGASSVNTAQTGQTPYKMAQAQNGTGQVQPTQPAAPTIQPPPVQQAPTPPVPQPQIQSAQQPNNANISSPTNPVVGQNQPQQQGLPFLNSTGGGFNSDYLKGATDQQWQEAVNYANQSNDPNIKSQIQQEIAKKYGLNTVSNTGINQGDTSPAGLAASHNAINAENMSFLDQQIAAAQQKATAQSQGNQAGISAGIGAVNREGATSVGNQMGAQQGITQLQTDLAQYDASLNNQKRQLSEAQAAGNQQLAAQLTQSIQDTQNVQIQKQQQLLQNQSTIAGISKTYADQYSANNGLANLSTDQLQAISQQTGGMLTLPQLQAMSTAQTRAQLNADQSNQLSHDSTALKVAQDYFINNGQPIDWPTAQKLASQTGLPAQSIMDLNTRAVQIAQDHTLTTDEQKAKTQELQLDAQNQLNGIYTNDQKAWKTYQDMKNKGMDADTLQNFVTASHLDISQNPEYLAKTQQAQAQATIDSINAKYQGGNPPPNSPDSFALEKAKAEAGLATYNLNVLNGGSTTTGGGGTGGGNIPSRNNNPGDIEMPAGGIEVAKARYGDPNISVETTSDGRQFLHFSTPELGFKAMGTLLQGNTYKDLTVAQAMQKWSGQSYGGEIAPSLANQKVSSLTPDQMNTLTQAMGAREGFNSGGQAASPTYETAGKLANTDYNPNNSIDQKAQKYLQVYLLQGKDPTAQEMGLTRAQLGLMTPVTQRAQELYQKATGENLPIPSVQANNVKLMNDNTKLLNNLGIQEGTVKKNFALSIDNLEKNGLNGSAQPINDMVNHWKTLMGDPAAATYLAQNSTLANEMTALLSAKSSSADTVSGRMESAGLIKPGASIEQQKQILSTIIQEAHNSFDAVKSQNANLMADTDKLELQTNNPNRQLALLQPKSQMVQNFLNDPNASSDDKTNLKKDLLGGFSEKQAEAELTKRYGNQYGQSGSALGGSNTSLVNHSYATTGKYSVPENHPAVTTNVQF